MLNKTVTIRRTVQHLIPLEMSRECKNEVSIELSESQEEPAEELDHRNDTDSEFEKRRFHRATTVKADLMRRLNEMIVILYQKRKFLNFIFDALSKWESVKDICELIQ